MGMDIALARMIAFAVDCVLSTLYTFLFVKAIWTLRSKRDAAANISAVIPAVLIFMFLLNTAQLCLQAVEIYQAFFQYENSPGGANGYFLDYGTGILPARDALFWLQSFLTDTLVVWRLYVVWLRNNYIIIPPIGLLVAGVASGIVMYVYTIRRTIADSPALIPEVDKWWEITLGLTIAVNIITPSLIIFRLWWIAREIGVLGSQSSRPYWQIGLVLMESGALYTAGVTAWLIIFLTGNLPALYMSAAILPTIVAIVPTLIVLRITNSDSTPIGHPRNHAISRSAWATSNSGSGEANRVGVRTEDYQMTNAVRSPKSPTHWYADPAEVSVYVDVTVHQDRDGEKASIQRTGSPATVKTTDSTRKVGDFPATMGGSDEHV